MSKTESLKHRIIVHINAFEGMADASKPETFALIVSEFLALDPAGKRQHQRRLAREFEVAHSTVGRWASMASRPHTRVARLVLQEIRKMLTAP